MELFNIMIRSGKFPDELKEGNVSSLFKKNDPSNKVDCRPITMLPPISKIFERLMNNQLMHFSGHFYHLYCVALCQVIAFIHYALFSIHHALLRFVGKCRVSL